MSNQNIQSLSVYRHPSINHTRIVINSPNKELYTVKMISSVFNHITSFPPLENEASILYHDCVVQHGPGLWQSMDGIAQALNDASN